MRGTGDQLTTAGISGFTWDADGNLATRTFSSGGIAERDYSWSAENRLVKAIISGDSVRFDYDPLGQPVVRRGLSGEGMRVTLYDGGSILADLDSAGNRVGEYVYDQGTDRPYALLKGATTVTGAQYFVQDDFGNVTGTLLDSVTVGQRVTYDGNGLPAVTGDQTNRLMWKGAPYDKDLLLTQLGARWYDPYVMRFISEDPLGLAGGINPYVFANNDPVNGSDPSGMSSFIDTLGVGGGGDDGCNSLVVFNFIDNGAPGDNAFSNALPNTTHVLWTTCPYKWNDPSQQPQATATEHGGTSGTNRAKAKPSVFHCVGQTGARNGVALGLDVAGFIPGEKLLGASAGVVTMVGVGIAASATSLYRGDLAGFVAGSAGSNLAAIGSAAKFAGYSAAEAIPVIGTVINAGVTAHDLYHAYQSYQACRAGH